MPHLRIHDLRHQYASFLVNSGRTLYEVQAILGHSTPLVSQRYSHLSSKSLQAAANSASDMIKGASKVAVAVVPAVEVPAADLVQKIPESEASSITVPVSEADIPAVT